MLKIEKVLIYAFLVLVLAASVGLGSRIMTLASTTPTITLNLCHAQDDSKSPICHQADFNKDRVVTLEDLAEAKANFGCTDKTCINRFDLNSDGRVDISDVAMVKAMAMGTVVVGPDKKYEDPGATAKDSSGNDLTSRIRVSGSVDLNKRGNYTLIYSVQDDAGNFAQVKRIVVVR